MALRHLAPEVLFYVLAELIGIIYCGQKVEVGQTSSILQLYANDRNSRSSDYHSCFVFGRFRVPILAHMPDIL
jgi:hypothetical protein